MIWFSSGDGYIKVRNPTNTAWQTVGTIGPPMKWTNVDIPSTAWKTGDIKPTFAGGEAGWVAIERRHDRRSVFRRHHSRQPGFAALFGYLWPAGGLPMYVAGTWTPVGRAPAPPPTSTRTGICRRRRCSVGRWRRGPRRGHGPICAVGAPVGRRRVRPARRSAFAGALPHWRSRRTIIRLPNAARTYTRPATAHRHRRQSRSLIFRRPGVDRTEKSSAAAALRRHHRLGRQRSWPPERRAALLLQSSSASSKGPR